MTLNKVWKINTCFFSATKRHFRKIENDQLMMSLERAKPVTISGGNVQQKRSTKLMHGVLMLLRLCYCRRMVILWKELVEN